MKRIVVAGLLVGLSVVAPNVVLAQAGDSNKKDANGMDMKSMPLKSIDKGMATDKNVATTTHQGRGVVKGVDAKDGVITVAHEPIKSLSWPAMTMGFKVKDKHLVDKVKAGDKVEFTFVQAGNDYVVTAIR
ncbi:MAG TPA: copper-binding protein [Roseiflexaceae bacterium]